MIIIDTSALARYFTGDDKAKAEKVAALLDSHEDLLVPDVVLVELEYVLRKLYRATKAHVDTAYRFLAARPNIRLNDDVRRAIALFHQKMLSFADCIIVTEAENGKLASFDRKLLNVVGVKRYWK